MRPSDSGASALPSENAGPSRYQLDAVARTERTHLTIYGKSGPGRDPQPKFDSERSDLQTSHLSRILSFTDDTMSILDGTRMVTMIKYSFWNNKGGTGKTSLAFQAICLYAEKYPTKRILTIDVCPQANLSELLLGGLNNKGSDKLLAQQGHVPRCSVGGYFQLRLPSPYVSPSFNATDFITNPSEFNISIPNNIDLVCGDPLLELQANAVNTLANNQIPGSNP